MPFLPVFLWTDILIYLLLAAIVGSIFFIRHQPHLVTPWLQVLKRKRGVISLLVLLVYISIGLLDSVHFRLAIDPVKGQQQVEQHYSPEVISLLDWLVLPLKQQVEKTYSAPFATHAFSREMQTADDGSLSHDYPRLKYGGRHLDNPADKKADITALIIKAVIYTMITAVIMGALCIAVLAKKQRISYVQSILRIWQTNHGYPVVTFVVTALLILSVGFILMILSQSYHVFGTDKVGQDVFYQTIKSVRTGLIIGTLTTLVMLPLAIFMGIAAGYFKGWVDDLIQYIYTTLNSIPGVLLIAAAVLMLQVYMNNHPENFTTIAERADIRLLFLCIILGVTSWTGLCRILRGETLKLREAEFVQASRALGQGGLTILKRHIMPNVMHIILIAIVLDFSGLVLAEAVLSYVGVGVDPSMHSWGNMINSARLEMARDPIVWWSLVAAFISMFILVLAANLFADVVRDAFDPRASGAYK